MKIILLLFALAVSTTSHLIITVGQSDSIVSASNVIDVQLLTNATIPNKALTFTFTTDFTTLSPCRVDGVNVTCTHTSTTTNRIVTIQAPFAANVYYDVSITVVNPLYANNFALTAAASGVSFSNVGTITIDPQTISCSLAASSPFVGDTSTATLTLGNNPIPSGSRIVINSSLQSPFSNLFANNPTCTSSGTLACSLSSSFGQQFLTIANLPTTSNLVISINSMNNSPYNASLVSAHLQLQNQNGNKMQICALTQPAPTSLRTSSSLSVQNWNSAVGSVSNITLTLNTYFTPFTAKILFIYDSNFTISPLTPTTSTLTAQNGNKTLNYLSGGVAVANSLSFLVQVTNPGTQQNVVWQIYVIYSNTLFVQSLVETGLSLTTLALSISLTPTVTTTMSQSNYNTSITIPFTLNNGPILTLSITHGQIQCNALNMLSNLFITVVNCSTSSLSVNASTLNSGTLWISFNVVNYISVRGDNRLSVVLTGAAPSYYSVGTGSTLIGLTQNSQVFTITNSNTTFAAATSFTVTQGSVLLVAQAQRKFSISMPSDIQLTSTVVSANTGSTVITNYTASSSTNTIVVVVQGKLDITISGVSNPIRYLGSNSWNITGSDLNDNPSSFSQVTQNPNYTPTTASISIQLTNSIIQATSTLEVTVIPALQYFFTPTITVTIPNSIIQNVCASCTALSSTAFSFLYSATIMKHNITVTNSLHPNNNTVSVTIATANVSFETGGMSYTLLPMNYGYLSVQTGFFGELGQVNITIISGPTTPLTLSYSNLTMLSSLSCTSCTNSQIIATGIVLFFQVASVTLTGSANGVVYATATATVSYICSSIQGCRICSNSSGSLSCQQCFTSAHTTYTLLYNNQCLQTCPIATYSNSITCVNCQTHCQYCDATGCQQCDINYYVYNLTCLAACPLPLVNNATHCIPVPIICPTNCANCPLNHVCTACDAGYFLIDNSCYSSCPNGYRVNSAGTACDLFTPPQETNYFPFGFVISAAILTILLVAIKCYEKRSLVMGNLIAFLSVVEIGSMIMTLVYTFQESVDLLGQALVFVLILSKILINVIFLVYFLKVIVPEQDFQRWREQEQDHQRLYKAMIILSSILSFQMIRILYSRLMGLRLFFGKFNTALIFKPLNFFTIAHFCTCGAALVFLSVRNILAQEGYKTSTFYSSVESIVLEGILLIACIIDNKKGYDDQFFQYQVYKVKNEYQSSHIQPIQIEEQVQNAGSMHQMLHAIKDSPKAVKSSQIMKNPMWVKKVQEPPELQDAQIQSDILEQNQLQKQQEGLIANVQEKKKKDRLFRRKIIDEWRRIEKQLPKHVKYMKNNPKDKNGERKWISPDNKKKISKAMKRSASLEEFQVKLPEHTGSIPERIKQYFYSVATVPKNQVNGQAVNGVNGDKNQKRKKRQRKLNKDKKKMFDEDGLQREIDEEYEQDDGELKIATMQVERGSLSIQAQGSQRNIFDQKEGDEEYNSSVLTQIAARSNPKQLGELKEHFQEKQEDQFEESVDSDENQFQGQEEGQNRKNRQQNPLTPQQNFKAQFNSNPRLNKQIIVDYRYDGQGGDKDKKYKPKRRRVNKQTQVVYLQRLAASSEKKVRPKGVKIDF